MYDSYVIAQVLGMLLTVLGIGCIFNQDHIRKVLVAVSENHAIQFIAAIVPLLVGSFIIVVHNEWVANWTVILTLLGWIIFLIGAVRAIFPLFFVARLKHLSHVIPVALLGALLLLLGLVLLYFGFNVRF